MQIIGLTIEDRIMDAAAELAELGILPYDASDHAIVDAVADVLDRPIMQGSVGARLALATYHSTEWRSKDMP